MLAHLIAFGFFDATSAPVELPITLAIWVPQPLGVSPDQVDD